MKNLTLPLIAVATLLFSACGNNEKDKKTETVSDTTFKTADTVIQKNENAAKLDTTEIMFLQDATYDAIKKSESSKKINISLAEDAIKIYIKLVNEDYPNTMEQLARIANEKGYILPKLLPESQMASIKKMDELEEEARNEYFVKLMLDEQKKAIGFYAQGSRTGDKDISVYAKSALPKLNDHLKQLMKIDSALLVPKANQGHDEAKISNRNKQ
ncbi:DUF4142 domain-containing protein [Pedobacter namyangjuensis]|uniref:DUF4142 domain-containing protein n=1 Tax=Pedobacter namyangjuensis TaxID=600626 RepID=UPI000DE48F48|nr:DUF4142 domain-containing protein [Pedobacter namyangjuensis]